MTSRASRATTRNGNLHILGFSTLSDSEMTGFSAAEKRAIGQ